MAKRGLVFVAITLGVLLLVGGFMGKMFMRHNMMMYGPGPSVMQSQPYYAPGPQYNDPRFQGGPQYNDPRFQGGPQYNDPRFQGAQGPMNERGFGRGSEQDRVFMYRDGGMRGERHGGPRGFLFGTFFWVMGVTRFALFALIAALVVRAFVLRRRNTPPPAAPSDTTVV